MRHQPQQLPKRQRGAVAVVVGISIFVLVGMIGLALDSGQLFVNKTELQNAADACALAAARELDGTADALTRADAAGVLVGTQNLVGFQGAAVTLSAADISYSEHLSPNSAYETSANADPATAKFVMCEVERSDIGMWFMGVRGFGDQTVSAYAVATLAPSQSTCAVPIGMCKMPGGSAPTFGLVVGQWYSGKFESGTPNTTGSYNWIDFDPEDGGGANEIKDLLTGAGQCELPPIGQPVGQQGEIAAVADAWNTRFGLYKGAFSLAGAPPDFTGNAYVQAGVGIGQKIGEPGSKVVETWPNPAPQNAYAGTHPDGTTANYQSSKAANAPYQSSNPAGMVGIEAYSISQSGELGQYGSQRRIALAPVVNCEDLAGTNPQPIPLQGYACVLLLNPIKGPDDVVMEYLGDPTAAGSPCSSFGLAGGAAGPLVPVLVQ
jgi:Flp pilus assembly protein TadG